MLTTMQLIDKVIENLNGLTLTGVRNWGIVIESIQMLSQARRGIESDEKLHKEQVQELVDRLEAAHAKSDTE